MRRNKKTMLIYGKKEEVKDVLKFLLDNVRDDPGADPIFTREFFEAYVAWREKRGLKPTLFNMHGFSRVLPYERVHEYDHDQKQSLSAISGKRIL